MKTAKSLDNITVIAELLQHAKTFCSGFTPRAIRLTIQKIEKRIAREGIAFLTKTLPSIGKEFDRALCGECSFYYRGLERGRGQLPKLFGELLERVFDLDGRVLPEPCIHSVRMLRQLYYLFYKYKLPYKPELSERVISGFIETENEIAAATLPSDEDVVVKRARIALYRVIGNLDLHDIIPRHGPGVVSTGERLSDKFRFARINRRIDSHFPFDAYFCASIGHVADEYKRFSTLIDADSSAKVILVPKDSRGPRLISCEPLENQWIQQGIMEVMVKRIESCRLTAGHVNFTDQTINQRYALLGSASGAYATLDLKDASDRVSLDLVRLLWPPHVVEVLEAVRSATTKLPSGEIIPLRKHAPMGSSLCFPVMALTIWALLWAASPDPNVRKDIRVYGDDVIVPTAFADSAIATLTRFGLRLNQSKCCTKGFFRESCGVDAFMGHDVTPVRFRTVWTHHRAAGALSSWVEYSNSFWERGYERVATYVAECIGRLYGYIPTSEQPLGCPAFTFDPLTNYRCRTRVNIALQRQERLVWTSVNRRVRSSNSGWERLLRFFSESKARYSSDYTEGQWRFSRVVRSCRQQEKLAVQTRMYTDRRASMLVRRWR